MKHASASTLLSIASFLDEIRAVPGVKERKLGIFYRKSRAFLHFHEDPSGLFVDVRLTEPDFQRFPINTAAQRRAVLRAIRSTARP